jgi:ubiquitin C-terminal hydrolase
MCERCNEIRAVSKTDKIYSLGRYFIIHLKRFTDTGGKIITKIVYPIYLNMQPYIQNDIKGREGSGLD